MREKLIEARNKKKMTVEEVAIKLNLSKSYYYFIEAGDRTPSYENMVKISEFFDGKPDDFFYN